MLVMALGGIRYCSKGGDSIGEGPGGEGGHTSCLGVGVVVLVAQGPNDAGEQPRARAEGHEAGWRRVQRWVQGGQFAERNPRLNGKAPFLSFKSMGGQ